MTSCTFHWETRSLLAMLENALSDIIINRYNEDKEPVDQIHVDFKYAPKSRVLFELQQKNQNIKLPVIAVSNGSLARASNRVVNKIAGAYYVDTTSPRTSAWSQLLQPVPVDLTVNLSIITRFQTDIDQILTNFIPYCDPYIVVSWKWPYIIPWADFEIRSHIKWSENVTYQYPTDISNTAPYRFIADTTFVIEGWMFKNQPPDGKSIYTIETTFTSVSDMGVFAALKQQENENTTYTENIQGRPQLKLCTPFYTFINQPTQFTATGNMLDNTATFYVSAADFSMFDTSGESPLSAGVTWNDYFSDDPYLASVYPGFSGIEVAKNAWRSDQYALYFNITPLSAGVFDLVALNAAGFGTLTQDSIRNNIDGFEYPSISGIEVR